MNKSLMIVSVGTGRSGEDIANGLAFSINQTRFDELCLIGSESSKEKTFPFLLEKISHLADGAIHEKISNEVNDIEKIIDEYDEYFKEFTEAGFTGENITVDYTSGTKSMSAALLFCAIKYEVKHISYVYGERYEGIVQTGTERRSILTPNLIFSQKHISQVETAFNQNQFSHGLSILRNTSFHPRYRAKAESLRLLCEAYDAWDKFAFNDALESIRQIPREEKKNASWGSTVGRQARLLEELSSSQMSAMHIIDLFYNAERRAAEGKYDDAVARLYRMIEMVGQVGFHKAFGIGTSSVKPETLPSEITPESFKRSWDPENEVFNFGLYDTFRVLEIADNQTGKDFSEHLNDFQKVLGVRNQSILAHGSTPISKEAYLKMREHTSILIPEHKPFAFPVL